MKYTLIRDSDSGSVKRLESDGNVIWEYSGGGFSPKSDDFIDAILNDGGFNQDEREAIKAVFGLFKTEHD